MKLARGFHKTNTINKRLKRYNKTGIIRGDNVLCIVNEQGKIIRYLYSHEEFNEYLKELSENAYFDRIAKTYKSDMEYYKKRGIE